MNTNTDFKLQEIDTGIYQLQDERENCATLVIGTQKALLFDTMLGLGDLKGFIHQLTNLPVIVINSHGHFDHIGGNCQFDEIYLNQRDFELLPLMRGCIEELEQTHKRPLSKLRESLSEEQVAKIRPLADDSVFDLGGLTVEIVALPGHTAGSVGALIREKRLLLAGDAATPQMCLFMDGCQPLPVYQKTLQKMMNLEFDTFLLGHFLRTFPKEILHKFMECTEIVGKKRGHLLVYTWINRYRGMVYFLEMRNPQINDIICIIIKEESAES